MKKLTFLFLLGWANLLLAQDQYTKFVEKPSVTWAADISDTFHFSNPNLSLLLRERLNKAEIKAGIIESEAGASVKKETALEAILDRVAPNRVKQIINADGNIISIIKEAENPLLSSFYFDRQTSDMVEMKQVLYVQSGKLKTYIPFVSPKYSVYTSWGQKLGIANAFSTAFTTKRSFSKQVRKKAISLGSSVTKINLEQPAPINMLKQLYGQNLLQALWPGLKKNYYSVYRTDSSIQISFSKINESLINPALLTMPLFETSENTGRQTINLELPMLTPASFSSIELVQDWYYHTKSNRVYSSITQLTLQAYKWTNNKKNDKETPVLKILLK
jgi:hypothetical protein